MMKYLILVLSFTFSSYAFSKNFRILHYNIKELDTSKIENSNTQFKNALKIIKSIKFDFLSLNEVQYDLKNVPNQNFTTEGENAKKILKLLELNEWHSTFNQANTGNNAKKKSDGSYVAKNSEPQSRKYADPLNFGIFPGQYSTMGLSQFPILKEIIIKDLKWKDFNPFVNLEKYTGTDGKPLPNNIRLFDKNFTDIMINVSGKIIHLILFHAVPSYHFGNNKSPNELRNKDQLRFLEWYLTGSTAGKIGGMKNIIPITHLTEKDSWIAIGDFNVGLKANKPGSVVLNRLATKSKLWMDNQGNTSESPGFKQNPRKFQLDYIFVSKNIKVVQAYIYGQESNWEDLGCKKEHKKPENENRVLISYKGERGKQCYAMINRNYFQAKMSSDHFALYGEFKF